MILFLAIVVSISAIVAVNAIWARSTVAARRIEMASQARIDTDTVRSWDDWTVADEAASDPISDRIPAGELPNEMCFEILTGKAASWARQLRTEALCDGE